jgi:hypothetical protein
MTVLLAAAMLVLERVMPCTAVHGHMHDPFQSPIPSDQLEIGAAAFYAPAFDNGGWDQVIKSHVSWGQIDPEQFPYSPEGYYCVHPGSELGDRLRVMNAITGEEVVCTVADVVAPADLPHWQRSVVIELSYCAFVAAGGKAFNRFVVTDAAADEP